MALNSLNIKNQEKATELYGVPSFDFSSVRVDKNNGVPERRTDQKTGESFYSVTVYSFELEKEIKVKVRHADGLDSLLVRDRIDLVGHVDAKVWGGQGGFGLETNLICDRVVKINQSQSQAQPQQDKK